MLLVKRDKKRIKMATEQQTKWNPKIKILNLLAAIWAMLASTTGVLVQTWLIERLPEWWAMLRSSLVFWVLINGFCVLFVIYPVCSVLRRLNGGNAFVKPWQSKAFLVFLLLAEGAMCWPIFAFCTGIFDGPGLTKAVFVALVLALVAFLLGVTIVSHKKLTAPSNGNLWEIVAQLTKNYATICMIAVMVCVIAFWMGVSLTLYPIMQGATL